MPNGVLADMNMRNIQNKVCLYFVCLSLVLVTTGCGKDDRFYNRLEGKWQLVKTQDLGNIEEYPTPENQTVMEFTSHGTYIFYDAYGNMIWERECHVSRTTITLYGVDYDTKYPYRLHNDTLRIRHLGGFEFYDEYFVKLMK